jgi:hypothetical protein
VEVAAGTGEGVDAMEVSTLPYRAVSVKFGVGNVNGVGGLDASRLQPLTIAHTRSTRAR